MESIWIEILFDGQPVENIIANNMMEANDLIKSIEDNGFSEMNEEIKEYWLSLGFSNNPKVTARLTK